MPDVERQRCTLPGTTLTAPGYVDSEPDGGDEPLRGPRDVLDRQDELGRTRERVTAEPHRQAPRVPGDAGQRQARARCARDRRDDTDRQVFRLEHRPLLDVHLAVAEDVTRATR